MKIYFGVKLYTLREVEQEFEIVPATLRTYIQRGEIIPRRIGHNVFFTEQAIQDFLYCRNLPNDPKDNKQRNNKKQ